MSTYDKQLSELEELLKSHLELPRPSQAGEKHIAALERGMGFQLPPDYRAFSKAIGSINWPYSIIDASECSALLEDLEDLDVPQRFIPFAELDDIVAGFRPDSLNVWLWAGHKLSSTDEPFLDWLHMLILDQQEPDVPELDEESSAASVETTHRAPRKAPVKRTSTVRSSRLPADAPKRLKQLVTLARKAKRIEVSEQEDGRFALKVAEDGGTRTSFVTAEELAQIESWSGIKALRKR